MKTLRITTSHSREFGFVGPARIREGFELGRLFNRPKRFEEYPYVRIYIHGKAETFAGYDIPLFLDGNVNNMFAPISKQNIILIVDGKELAVKSVRTLRDDRREQYYFVTEDEAIDLLHKTNIDALNDLKVAEDKLTSIDKSRADFNKAMFFRNVTKEGKLSNIDTPMFCIDGRFYNEYELMDIRRMVASGEVPEINVVDREGFVSTIKKDKTLNKDLVGLNLLDDLFFQMMRAKS